MNQVNLRPAQITALSAKGPLLEVVYAAAGRCEVYCMGEPGQARTLLGIAHPPAGRDK